MKICLYMLFQTFLFKFYLQLPAGPLGRVSIGDTAQSLPYVSSFASKSVLTLRKRWHNHVFSRRIATLSNFNGMCTRESNIRAPVLLN